MLYSINNFRAISIFLIVASHALWVSGWNYESKLEQITLHYILGGTFLFLFISGYMFSHVSLKKYSYLNFIKGKFLNLFLPYVILSFPLILFALKTHSPYGEYFFSGDEGLYSDYIKPFFHYLLTGRVITGYWYMPFIFLVFAFSPFLVYFCKLKSKYQIAIMFIWFSISLFIWRPVDNMNPIQCYFYFMPVFLLGSFINLHHDFIMKHYNYFISITLILSVFMMIYQVYFLGVTTNLEKHFFDYRGINVNIVEKSLLTIFIFLIFERYLNYNVRFLDLIAKSSFGIYLTHTIIIAIFTRMFDFKFNSLFYLLFLTFIITLLCFSLNYIAKFKFGRKVRYLIG